jgi:hypothetical protein
MQERCSQDSRATGSAPAGATELEPGPSRRAAKARRVAPAHSGHRTGTRGSGRADNHAEPRCRPPSPTARPGGMEPGAAPRSAEPAARHGDGRKKMAAAVAAATAASHAPLTPMARAGRRATDGGCPGEGRGEAARGPAGGGGRAGGWREVAGTVCGSRNMAGVCDAAAPGEGGGGGADGPERTGRGEAEQPGGGGHGPAPQHTETLGFYESDRRREKRRGRAGEASERAGGRAALGRGGLPRGRPGCGGGDASAFPLRAERPRLRWLPCPHGR